MSVCEGCPVEWMELMKGCPFDIEVLVEDIADCPYAPILKALVEAEEVNMFTTQKYSEVGYPDSDWEFVGFDIRR